MMGMIENARGWIARFSQMGFESRTLHGRQRKLTGERIDIKAHFPRLGDYAELRSYHLDEDVEAEHATWPDVVDQCQIGHWCGAFDLDDMEDDDPAGGDICDVPHDACVEDGI